MNHKLNFLKCFACFGVVFIHITFPELFGQIVGKASAFAVPVFFLIAGYYACGSDTTTIKRRLIKILKILLFAYLVFFVYTVAYAFMYGEDIPKLLAGYFNFYALVKAVCFCTIEFAIPLWYLIAMAETYIVWYFVVKAKKEHFLLKFIPVLFVLQVILTSYCETFHLAWFWKINFITRALPWFLSGYYIHTSKSEKLRDINLYKLIIMATFGCVIAILPAALALPFDFSAVGYIPYAFGLFLICLKKPENHVCRFLEYIGNKLSLNIYIFHVPMASVISFGFAFLGIDTMSDIWIWCRPILVLIATIGASWVLYVILNILKRSKQKMYNA